MRRDTARRVILFTRFPEPGRCKTRLIPMLGPINAAELQRRMTAHAIDVARRHGQTDRLCDLEVRYSGGSAPEMAALYGNLFYREQVPGSLGRKMFQSIEQALSEGIDEVLIMGSDCVGVSPELIERGFNALRGADLVMGPALDGGYYLIGVKQGATSGVGQGVAELFSPNMPWGSGSVLKKTLAIADRWGMTCRRIDSLPDLDTPEGLPEIQGGPFLNDMPRPIISIIIPTLNEAENISETIRCAQADSVEIIVSDGGSRDATRQTARRQGARVICVEGGRGAQQNEGAKRARGQILLFLHGDTRLPKHFSRDILTLLAVPGASAGAFRLGISGSRRAFALVEFFTHLRSVFFQLPYGDQGLFMRKDMFNGAGGFLNIPIMEDYALVGALKKKGRVLIAPSAAITSGRRWEKMGCLKTLAINQLMIMGYHLNVKPKTLETLYKRNAASGKTP